MYPYMNFRIQPDNMIVILEIGGLGDFIMATPTLRKIRETIPDNPVTLFVAERTVPLAEDFSRNILTKPINILPFLTTGNFILRNLKNLLKVRSVSRKKPALLIDLSAIESEAAAVRRQTFINLFKSRNTAGRNTDQRGGFYTFSSDEILFSKPHEVERKYDVIRALGISGNPENMDFYIDNESSNEVRNLIKEHRLKNKTMIGINIGAYRPNRRWPMEKVLKTISVLQSNDRHFLIFGGKTDAKFVDEICRSAIGSVTTPVVNQPFKTVGAWLKTCHMFITNDTGLMHFAAALEVPTIAIFGPENPYRYGPWGKFPNKILKYSPNSKEQFEESDIFFKDAINHISLKTVTEEALAYLKTGTFN